MSDVAVPLQVPRPPARGGVLRRALRNRVTFVAACVAAALLVVAALAPWIAPADPNALGIGRPLASPGPSNLLGTDGLGRDTLSRVLFATRLTLAATAQGLAVAVVLGVPAGLVAGYLGGFTDGLLSRVVDALLSLPPLIFALAIIGVLGTGLTNAMVAVGVILAPRFFRVTRVAAEGVRHEGYIEACRAVGVPMSRIVWRHVLPNASGPLFVQVSFTVGLVISAEASLSFLGLGVQLPDASWGSMLRTAFDTVYSDAFQLVVPATMIVLTVLSAFLIGDGLRDALSGGRTDD